jgi:uncharacterized membrane protein YvbJ
MVKFCRECGAKTTNDSSRFCRICGTGYSPGSSPPSGEFQQNQDTDQPAVLSLESVQAQLKKLIELRDSGSITEQEFSEKETELLKRM